MGRAKVELISSGMASLLRDSGVASMLQEKAVAVANSARATAPFENGDYRDGITVVRDTTDRAVARVVATAPHSHLVESRTGNLARALDAAGGG